MFPKLLTLLPLIALGLKGVAADASFSDSLTTQRQRVNVAIFGGYLWAHHSKMEAMYKQHLMGIEADYAIQTNGQSPWESYYNYPEYGIAASFYELGNPASLGNAYAIQPYIAFPLLKPTSWGNIFIKGAIGICYVTKTWDRVSNYKNVGIGSHLNAAAKFEVLASVRISKQWYTTLGLAFSHFSNGSTNNPNAGINMPNLNAGVTYAFGPTVKFTRSNRLPYNHRITLATFASISIKDAFPESYGHFPVYTLTNELCKPINQHSCFTIDFDLILDKAHQQLMREDGVETSDFEMIKTGITAGYLMRIEKVSAIFQMGSNIYSYYKTAGMFYQRLGLRYTASSSIDLQVALRTNWFNADCIEFGVGFRWIK